MTKVNLKNLSPHRVQKLLMEVCRELCDNGRVDGTQAFVLGLTSGVLARYIDEFGEIELDTNRLIAKEKIHERDNRAEDQSSDNTTGA